MMPPPRPRPAPETPGPESPRNDPAGDLFRSIFEACPDALLVLDERRVVEANPAACALFDADESWFADRIWADLCYAGASNSAAAPSDGLLERARRGERTALELTCTTAEGERFEVEAKVARLGPSDTRCLATLRRRSPLVEELSGYRRLAMHATDMLSRHDLQGRYTYVSPAVRALLDYEPEDLLGRSAYDFFHPDDVPDLSASHASILELPETSTVMWRARRKSGAYTWVETTSRTIRHERTNAPVEIIAITRDVSKRREAQAALRLSEARLRNLISNFPLVIFSTDADGVFTLSEGKGLDVLGLSAGEVVGQSAFEVYKGVPDVIDGLREVLAGGRFRGRMHIGEVHFDVSLSSVRDATGQVQGLIGVAADISEMVAAQDARLHLERQLLNAQKLETIGVLAGGVAHDFNNLLSAMMGNLELALEDLPEGSPARESVEPAMTAAKRAAHLTRQMLAYSGKGRQSLEPVDVGELIEEQSTILQAQLPDGARLSVARSANLPLVDADPAQLRQIIVNLVTNAAEALESGAGTVGVRVGTVEADAKLLSGTLLSEPPSPGRYVLVEVSDDGVGMSEATSRRILEPFFSTKFAGRGLGLAAASGIVRAHGGALLLQTSEGRGSTLQVLLPCADATGSLEASPPEPAPAPEAPPDRAKMILIVDDEQSVRTLCQRVLERKGFDTLVAGNGLEGIELLKAHTDEVDCVLLDLNMPGLDGLSTFDRMREVRSDLKVLVSSGLGASAQWEELSARGIAGVLDKPYRLSALADRIESMLGGDADEG